MTREPDWSTADGRVKLYCGDCLDILPTLSGIDAVVTDPPYGMAWNTDSTRFTGGDSPKARRGAGRDDWGEIANDATPFDPSPWLQFDRVVMFGANHYAARLPAGTTLIWIKRSDDLFGSFLSDAEVAWMKGGHGVYCYRKQFGGLQRAREANESKPAHPTQKPICLMEWCIKKTKCEGTVLDPYMGSGTTGVACVRLGRQFIGIEREPRYFEIAVKRIKSELERAPLFEPKPTYVTRNLFDAT